VEFGSTLVVNEVTQDDRTAGVSRRRHLHVSGNQDRTLEFGGSSVSDLDVAGVGEIPHNARRHACRETTIPVTPFAVPVDQIDGIDLNITRTLEVDEDRLVFTIVVELVSPGVASKE